MKKEITCEILKKYGTFDDSNEIWKGQVNLVSWNKKPAKIDVRYWNTEDETKSRRVGTLTEEAAKKLRDILNSIFE